MTQNKYRGIILDVPERKCKLGYSIIQVPYKHKILCTGDRIVLFMAQYEQF